MASNPDDPVRAADRPVARWSLRALVVPVARVSLVGALLTDVTYARSAQMQWSAFSAWLLAFGVAFAALAWLVAVAHLVFTRVRPRPVLGWLLLVLDGGAVVAALINNFVHARDGWTAVVPDGLWLSVLTVVFLLAAAIVGHRLRAWPSAMRATGGERLS